MQGVVDWFVRHGERPLAPPARFREYAPLDDDRDGSNDFSDQSIRGLTFALEYCDSRGWDSTRTVRCLAVDPIHPAAIRAHCNVRGEERTFRVDRIISIADLRTGRILSSHEQMALLAPYLHGAYRDPDFVALAALQEATRDGVFALLQLAMQDGTLGTAARVAVLNYVKAEAKAVGCRVPPHAYIELWLDNLSPPLEAVADSVANLLADKDKFARLLPCLLKVMRSNDGHPDREEAMRELMGLVRSHFRQKVFAWPRDVRATR